MTQRFIAREPFTFPNGAIGWRPGGPFDCLGPYAKVQNCPIRYGVTEGYSHRTVDTGVRLTCYAQGYADSFFSVPAATRYRGHRIRGYFTHDDDGGVQFHVTNDDRRYFGFVADAQGGAR